MTIEREGRPWVDSDECQSILPDDSVCAKKATHEVSVRTPVLHAVVLLCDEHFRIHNEKAARRRTSVRR